MTYFSFYWKHFPMKTEKDCCNPEITAVHKPYPLYKYTFFHIQINYSLEFLNEKFCI